MVMVMECLETGKVFVEAEEQESYLTDLVTVAGQGGGLCSGQ